MLRAALLLALLLGAGGARAQGAAPGALDFLVQSNCVDAAGRVVPGLLPVDPRCGTRRPVREGDPLGYRKHDWPGRGDVAARPLGYQASDAYATTLLGRPAAAMTFDFGTGGRRFGVFDPGQDGGDAALVQGDAAGAILTEDGEEGVQWLVGPGCRAGGVSAGWLFFGPGSGEALAELNRTRDPRACPTGFDRALTRWTRRSIEMPLLLRGRPAGTFRAEMIVSEHFARPDARSSDGMERFWFARGLGKVRWEAWRNLGTTSDPGRWERQAGVMAVTGRCAEVAGGGAPGDGRWVMVDCRSWTNFVAPEGAMPRAGGWPTLEAFR